MKKIYLLIIALLLTSCTPNNINPPSENESITESETISESYTESEENESESESEIQSEESESESESELENESESEEDIIPASGQTLPIGNKTVSGPENVNNPIDVSNWINFDLYDSLPEHWSYIMGNNKVNSRGDFYSSTAGGGFKFSSLYYGLQTPLINSWVKLEIRLRISVVKNNSQKKDDDEPIFHIYGYNSKGKYIQLDYLNQGSITANSEGQEIKLYIRNIDISYLEFRLNAFPYKGQQCYNFGVDQISIKGWQWE